MKKQKSVLAVLGSIVLVSAFLVVACGSGNRSGSNEPLESKNQPMTPPTVITGEDIPTSNSDVPTPTFYKVGEKVTVPGVVQITVTQVKHVPLSQAKPGITNEDMPKNGYFLIVSVKMTNLGKEPMHVMVFNYGIRDKEDNMPPSIFMGDVQGYENGFPSGTAPTGFDIKGDIIYVVTAPGSHPYYFSFQTPAAPPLFWQID